MVATSPSKPCSGLHSVPGAPAKRRSRRPTERTLLQKPVASPPTTFCSTKSHTVPEPASRMTSGPRRAEVAEPPKQRCPYPRWQPNDSGSGSASKLTPEPQHILETVDGVDVTHTPYHIRVLIGGHVAPATQQVHWS